MFGKSKEGKDQESIQSSTTPDTILESDKAQGSILATQQYQKDSPFPAGDHKAARNRQDGITKANAIHMLLNSLNYINNYCKFGNFRE